MVTGVIKRYRKPHGCDLTEFDIKNFKFKIIKYRTGCQYIGYFTYSENLYRAAQNLRLGHMPPAGWT